MSVFIASIDGPDFTGKTTISALLIEELRSYFKGEVRIKHSILPSDMVTGAFTKMLRSMKEKVSPEVFSLSYALDHLHHNSTVIEPLVEDDRDYIMILERSLLTTMIYQAQMQGADMDWIWEINKYVKYLPDLSIILNVDYEELLRRKEVEKRHFDAFESDEALKKQVDIYSNISDDLKKKFNVHLINCTQGEIDRIVKRASYQIIKLFEQKQATKVETPVKEEPKVEEKKEEIMNV